MPEREALLIVESPTKVKTLMRYLGGRFNILASMGHIKDLPKTKMGVDPEKGFKPEYSIIEGKKKIVQKIKKAAEKAKKIYLAPDPDREGEAIAWHIAEEIGRKREGIYRVLFNEITKKGVEEGLKNLQELNEWKYESQKARRILDRLVGYELSPLLWKKVKRGLSAGRVQSVALMIIVDREREIATFVPREYWKVFCDLAQRKENAAPFRALVTRRDGKKIEIPDVEHADEVRSSLLAAAFSIENVKKQKRRRNPPPPLTTSMMQQEASRRFHMSARRTMQVAQQLYEGVEIGGEGSVGLITYMRTDSTRLAAEAVEECRKHIAERYGTGYVPASPNVFPQKKTAQGAHEAIRPTSMDCSPAKIKPYLGDDQMRIYTLVWNRFVACQMKPAEIDETKIVIVAVPAGSHGITYLLEAVGSEVAFDGWLAVEPDMRQARQAAEKDTGENGSEEEERPAARLPPLAEGELLVLAGQGVIPVQKFTRPPPRFTEGSLIRELEEKGIGRPSTYATIISTILDRSYVRKLAGILYPMPLGEIVTRRLVKHFPKIMNVEFTARMEESLDRIESKDLRSEDILKEFYLPFRKDLDNALVNMKAGISPEEYQQISTGAAAGLFKPVEVEASCRQCGRKMVLKSGRYGLFLSCSGYPACRQSLSAWSGVKCPMPGCGGEIVEIKPKKTSRGKGRRTFYGCSNYSDQGCRFTLWDAPVLKKCPACGNMGMVIKREKGGSRLMCMNEKCKHEEELPL